jgi:hypothetical protein
MQRQRDGGLSATFGPAKSAVAASQPPPKGVGHPDVRSPSPIGVDAVTRRTVAPNGESEFVVLLFKEQWLESGLPGYWRILGVEQAAWQRTSEHWESYSRASSMPHGVTANPALYGTLLAKRDPWACRNGAEIHQ